MSTDPFNLDLDAKTGFYKIGHGAIGGKAGGLVLLNTLLQNNPQLRQAYPDVEFGIPDTLVIASDGFETFVRENRLGRLAQTDLPDEAIAEQFLKGRLPRELQNALGDYLVRATHPLAVRSSGLMEDSRYHAYAGLYHTYMLANDQPDISQRLARLVQAIQLVYASTFFKEPKAYARRLGHRLEDDRMAVVIQQVAGERYAHYFYPAISGVAQSRNYYPLTGMKPEDGMATIALGLGRQVVSGERALRFCPKFPRQLPQRSTVDEILAYSQRRFYALQLDAQAPLEIDEGADLARRDVGDAVDEFPLQMLAGTYVLAEHRIRDTVQIPGPRVVTFAGVLKYDLFPLAGILRDLLSVGEDAIGSAVEIEFAVNLVSAQQNKPRFSLLQMRPMSARAAGVQVTIQPQERQQALCYTEHAMGNVDQQSMNDIVYVKPEVFEPSRTREVAQQVAALNAALEKQQRHYLLIGPGRWGSADHWLGIPVRWTDISGVGAIVELASEKLKAEPSQGAHFFHNLAALGISYLNVRDSAPDEFNWPWLIAQPKDRETEFVAHVRLARPVTLNVDGRTSRGIICK